MKQLIRFFSLGMMVSTAFFTAGYYLIPEKASDIQAAPLPLSEEEMIIQLENAGYQVLTAVESENKQKTDETKTQTVTEQKPVSLTLAVEEGMTLAALAAALYEKGIIEDAEAFSEYMNIQEYSTRIQIGEFTFHTEMSYKEIAETLTGE